MKSSPVDRAVTVRERDPTDPLLLFGGPRLTWVPDRDLPGLFAVGSTGSHSLTVMALSRPLTTYNAVVNGVSFLEWGQHRWGRDLSETWT